MIFLDLNPAQKEAVTHISGPLLVVAGAGSGKTKVLTHRIAYLVSQGVNPKNILAVTFTNKAADEMKDRIARLLKKSGPESGAESVMPTIGTFHSVCVRVLRREYLEAGIKKDFIIYDDGDQISLLKKIIREADLDENQWQARLAQAAISQAKNELKDAGEFRETSEGFFQETMSGIYEEYENRLQKQGILDFDDLLFKTVILFRRNGKILEKYQNIFQFILVDEYQDTNFSQYQLIKLLGEKNRNVCCVGDLDQSIYGWRGADFRNILNFEKDFPEAKIVLLEQNYRSTQNILDAAHHVISRNAHRKEKRLWTENPKGLPLVVAGTKNAEEEAEFVIEEIERLIKKEKKNLLDFTVLFRTNAQSRVFEERLIEKNLPYKIVGGTKFYARREIKDIIAYLRFLKNPDDEQALLRIVNVPPRGIGQKSQEKIKRLGLKKAATEDKKTTAFSDLIEESRQTMKIKIPSAFLKHLTGILNLESYLKDGTPDGESRWENVEEFMALAKHYDRLGAEDGWGKILEDIALLSEADSVETKKELLNLMTLHAAKGLEFPVVFMAGMEEGLFPHSRSILDPLQMEEERRLCYVGITRAKEKLYLTFAGRRLLHGNLSANPPSRFISEIPEELYEMKRLGTIEIEEEIEEVEW